MLLEIIISGTQIQTLNYDDSRLTENTRTAYPLTYILNCSS